MYNISMVNEIEIKEILVENLIYYRKQNKLTQSQLAEKLNYSDKTVSKWERGESIPDIFILSNIANIYGITLNDLINKQKTKPVKTKSSVHKLVTLLSILLVWFLFTLAFVITKFINPDLNKAWLSFIFAIPVTFIVCIVFSCIWGTNCLKFLSVSCLCWSIPLTLVLTFHYNYMWLSFICVIPFQFLVIFFFLLKNKTKLIN